MEWIGQVLIPRHINEEETVLPPEMTQEEMRKMLAEQAQEWQTRSREKGRRAGLPVGRVEGREEAWAEQRTLLCRQAARKFDAAIVDRLAVRLVGIPEPERLAEVGEWLIECDHGEELLKRVAGLCATSVPGDGPARG